MRLPPNQWSVVELLDRCSLRPADEIAWEEFVRRFHPTIRTNVTKVFSRKTRENVERRSQFADDTVDDLVQMVYYRLIDDGSEALRRFVGAHANSIYQYLILISINVVKDYFRELSAQKRPKIAYSLDELIGSDGTSALLGEAASGLDGAPLATKNLPYSMDEIESALEKAAGWRNRDRDILIFKMHYLDGMTLDEITRAEGIKLSTVGVNSIITRVTRKIRKLLAKQSRRPLK
jgi:RNA polymerase sigma factor (sigma-70 family)